MSDNTDTDRLKRSIDWGIALLLLVASGGFAVVATALEASAAVDFAAIVGFGFLLLSVVWAPPFVDGLDALKRAVRRWRNRSEVTP